MSTKNRTRRTTTRNIRFPNQMIEQINIALDQKGSGNFSAWVIEACRRRLCSEKRVSPEAKKRVTLLNCSESRSDQIEAI
ncbi:YlcI/YnfO family protein [Escherichia coli]|uniref:YlcI/YnfO family protein n=1 Tax=Escherichia coli TaxID=562 RepID=UPI002041286E|nr:YlcI/YnfO family protein [Escherichia coli]